MTRLSENQPKTVMLELPSDLAQLLQLQSQQLEQPLTAVILALLKSAVEQSAIAPQPQALPSSQTAASADSQAAASSHQLLETPHQAGSSMASLWLRVNQAGQPPVSVPSTLSRSSSS